MRIKLDKRFQKRVKGIFGKYEFQVGVLDDKPHRDPLRGERGKKGQDVLKNFSGGPARKVGRSSSQAVSDVSASLRNNLGFNYLTQPFKEKSTPIMKFTKEFFKLAFGRSQKKRCENLLQAIVRNPMLKGGYGHNSALTQRIKGFDRLTIDTGQLFKAIKATTKVKRV